MHVLSRYGGISGWIRTVPYPNGRAGVQNSTWTNAQFPSLSPGTGTGPVRPLTFTVYHLVCDAIDMGQMVEIQGSCRRESASGSLILHGRRGPCLDLQPVRTFMEQFRE